MFTIIIISVVAILAIGGYLINSYQEKQIAEVKEDKISSSNNHSNDVKQVSKMILNTTNGITYTARHRRGTGSFASHWDIYDEDDLLIIDMIMINLIFDCISNDDEMFDMSADLDADEESYINDWNHQIENEEDQSNERPTLNEYPETEVEVDLSVKDPYPYVEPVDSFVEEKEAYVAPESTYSSSSSSDYSSSSSSDYSSDSGSSDSGGSDY